MSIKLCVSLLCCFAGLSYFVAACDSKLGGRYDPTSANPPTAPATTEAFMKPAVDACGLLQSSEIESIQGVQVQATQPTAQKHGKLVVSQCYYTAYSADGSKNLSVYLQVIQPDAGNAQGGSVKEFWEERFRNNKEKKRRPEHEAEESLGPPVLVSGIGDEAFWLASDRGGALYVLKNDRVVRVTAGAPVDGKNKIEKPKALAKKIIERLT